MKKIFLFAMTSLALVSCSSDKGKVTIQLPGDFTENTLVVSHVTIDNIFTAQRQEDLNVIYDTLEVKNGVAKLTLDLNGAARYDIEPPVATRNEPDFYAAPDETLKVTITSFEPLNFEVTGTELMEDLTALTSTTRPRQQEYVALVSNNDDITEDQVKTIMGHYDAAIRGCLKTNVKTKKHRPEYQAIML